MSLTKLKTGESNIKVAQPTVMGDGLSTLTNFIYVYVTLITIASLPIMYIFVLFCQKRREHHKHVRTGSFKGSNQPQTSPSVQRRVRI